MRKTFAILIGFIHDFSAGLWAATVLAVWWLQRSTKVHPAASEVLRGLQHNFFWMGLAFTATVLLTGAGRGFTYVSDFYGPEAESRRRALLINKHVLLLLVFGLGTWWQYRMAFS